MISPELRAALRTLTLGKGYGEPLAVLPLEGGANNRVFRVQLEEGQVLLKAYFHHPSDPRDRLKTEFSFLSFAWNAGIRKAPLPMAADPANHLGLYEFIEGSPLHGMEPTSDHIKQAADFIVALNLNNRIDEARRLTNASEACFSVDEHLNLVTNRIKRLQNIDPRHQIACEARELVRRDLNMLWDSVCSWVQTRAREAGLDPAKFLTMSERCLSPSDFGFHNALVTSSENIRFLDFEYAGWDDPAKMVCDFFCQPKVPVPLKHFSQLVDAAADCVSDNAHVARRCQLLMPVFYVKWSCIVLNEFVAVDGDRRHFASGSPGSLSALEDQVNKAREFMRKAQECL